MSKQYKGNLIGGKHDGVEINVSFEGDLPRSEIVFYDQDGVAVEVKYKLYTGYKDGKRNVVYAYDEECAKEYFGGEWKWQH